MIRPTVLAAGAAAALACGASTDHRAYEYMPDMARSPAYKAFAPNPITRDGLTLQAPVPGTVSRSDRPFHYGSGEDEAARAGRELADPLQPTAAALAEGKALFETYCLVCHGAAGHGDGPLADKIPRPPSYTSERLMQFPPGRLYHVITMGARKMPSYAAQLSPEERWKVVTYVHHVLQHGGAEPRPTTSGVLP